MERRKKGGGLRQEFQALKKDWTFSSAGPVPAVC